MSQFSELVLDVEGRSDYSGVGEFGGFVRALFAAVLGILAVGVSPNAFSQPLSLLSVGDFGGIRLKAPCFFGEASRMCSLDTMGSVSVVSEGPDFADYSVTGHEKVSGIGIELSCDVVDVNDLSLLNARPAHLYPLRCAVENSAFPLIGLPFFDDQSFVFDFPNANFSWEPVRGEVFPLIRIGGDHLWIAVPAQFAGEALVAAFDTGNPVTIVTRAFVEAHPANFSPSLKPISPSLLAKGLSPFDVLSPIVVNGVELKADYVYAGSQFPAPIFDDSAILLGMNHISQARWAFDLHANQFQVKK